MVVGPESFCAGPCVCLVSIKFTVCVGMVGGQAFSCSRSLLCSRRFVLLVRYSLDCRRDICCVVIPFCGVCSFLFCVPSLDMVLAEREHVHPKNHDMYPLIFMYSSCSNSLEVRLADVYKR